MSADLPSPPLQPSKRRRYVLVLLMVVLTGAAIFFLQKAVLTQVAEKVLPLLAASEGWDLQWDHLQVGFFVPLTMEGVRIRTVSSDNGVTSLRVGKAIWEFSNVWDWWKGRQRFFRQLTLEGLEGVLDGRSTSSSSKKFLDVLLKGKANCQLMLFPSLVEVQAPDLNLLFDGVTYRVRDFSANLSEDSLGAIQYSFAKVETPVFEKKLPASSALATWKSGVLGIAEWPLFSDCTMELMNINFLNPDGLGIDLDMAAFGGTIKGNLVMKTNEVRPYWDAAFIAQQVELKSLAKALKIQTPVRGILKEGKLTFRGRPGNIADSEASVHVSAEEFRWNDLGWQTLDFGADLINHRIAIPEFHLRQKENFLSLNGSASIPKDLRNLSKTPFEISVVGDIRDLEALAGLLGPKFHQLHGRMTLDGSLWSGKDGPNGYFKLESSDMRFREAHFTSARLNTVFRNGNVDVTSCELWNGEDFLLARGILDLNDSHQYSGQLSLRARNIASYRSLMEEDWQQRLHSGGIKLTWQGDGIANRHSGSFNMQMDRLISLWTPGGVSGNMTGTFSPGYISFDHFELFRDSLRLAAQMSLSPFGIKVDNLRIHKGTKQLVEGLGFFPVDLFAMAHGASWKSALRSEKPVFLDLKGEKMELGDLCHVTGQNLSVSGLVQGHLFMTGNPESLNLNGQISGEALSGKWNGQEIPGSKLRMNVESRRDIATLAGSLVSHKMGEIRGNFSVPLNSGKTFADILNSSQPLHGALQVEKLDIAMLKFLFPGMSQLAGKAKAKLILKNTLSYPKVDGQLTLTGGVLEFAPRAASFSDLQMAATVRDNQVSFDNFQGKLGSGAFRIKGGVDFSKMSAPQYEVQFMGHQLPLHQDADLTLQANMHLLAQGTPQSGKISGAIRLQNSELRRRVEILPVGPSFASNARQVEKVFSWEKRVPSTFASWKLDISISNDMPFLVNAELTHGEMISHLHLGGSLRNALPSGSVEFKNLRVFFPSAVAEIPSGLIFFDPKYPRELNLDAKGFVNVAGYDLQITVTGPLEHPSFFFTAEPPISQQCIELLLFTGHAPCGEDMRIVPSLSQTLFPLQMLRTFAQKAVVAGSKFDIQVPESLSMTHGRMLYEFPGTPSEYFFKLVH